MAADDCRGLGLKCDKNVFVFVEEACKTALQDELMTSKASVKQLKAVQNLLMKMGAPSNIRERPEPSSRV